jgi:hypothetical protein
LSFDLSAYAELEVLVRLEFDTVDAGLNNFEGWYVDRIELAYY